MTKNENLIRKWDETKYEKLLKNYINKREKIYIMWNFRVIQFN